ncbi:MAG: MFS transporter [Candidatus Sumerlaeia bacterium]
MEPEAERRPAHLLNECERPIRAHYVILGMSWAGWMFDFYDLMLFSFLLIPIKQTLGLSNNALSLVLGSSLAATAVGGIAFGWLSDRFGRKTVLSWTILVYSVGALLCGFAHGVVWLLVFRIVTGLGVGGEWATGQTLVGETFPARMRARFAAVMQTGAPLGVALAAIVGGFFEPFMARHFGPEWGWRSCFFVSVLPALMVCVIRRSMPESDVWQERERQRRLGPPARPPRPLIDMYHIPKLRHYFHLGMVLSLTDMSAYWFTYTWLPAYLYERLGFSMTKSGLWLLATQAGGFLGYLSFGFVADWKGRRTAYSVFSAVWAVGLLAITWFWTTIAVWPLLTLAFMFMVGVGTGNFSGYGPIFAELFPTQMRNTVMGTVFNLARGVQFFTPWIITMVAARYGLGGGISLAAAFAIFTGLWVWVLPETRGTRIGVEEQATGPWPRT